MTAHDAVPPLVAAAASRAREAGFAMSCGPAAGRFLAVLAAHLAARAKVLELGTGAGAGTAWITSGLLPRTDVTVTTIDNDRAKAALAARGDWPSFVNLRYGEARGLLAEGGTYDLIFADAPDGKWHGLDRTIATLSPHGMLVVDDMTPMPGWPGNQRAGQDRVRQALLTAPQLIAVELAHGFGIILSTRR
jgi:predicted O-methyltransferase YrrM